MFLLTHLSIIKILQKCNNLTNLLGNDGDTEEISQVKLSPYLDMHELSEKLYDAKSNLTIISLNAQSIMQSLTNIKSQ